jgi:hypothetical protein
VKLTLPQNEVAAGPATIGGDLSLGGQVMREAGLSGSRARCLGSRRRCLGSRTRCLGSRTRCLGSRSRCLGSLGRLESLG